MGLNELTNHALLAAADQATLDVMVTAGQHIRSQQKLGGRRIALVVRLNSHRLTVRERCETS